MTMATLTSTGETRRKRSEVMGLSFPCERSHVHLNTPCSLSFLLLLFAFFSTQLFLPRQWCAEAHVVSARRQREEGGRGGGGSRAEWCKSGVWGCEFVSAVLPKPFMGSVSWRSWWQHALSYKTLQLHFQAAQLLTWQRFIDGGAKMLQLFNRHPDLIFTTFFTRVAASFACCSRVHELSLY